MLQVPHGGHFVAVIADQNGVLSDRLAPAESSQAGTRVVVWLLEIVGWASRDIERHG